ncbi:MAG: bifunctional folylpolyglutamate synthase/dihydrofolate synthase [Methanomassiliicoccales archaeon]|nr:bifunctional folylpolyglutamate synthase/dihydrofolate synthase [Methanomassiliicoccales archaeon]
MSAIKEDIDWLFSLENMGIKLGLSNIRSLLSMLGDPQDRFGTVHVAGSNGKGSVSAMTASILRSAGYRTGLYTSPHLVRYTERMTVDGNEMDDVRLSKMIGEVRELLDSRQFPHPLTFFEITTALAFLYFSDENVEEAVIEVGMGGRLDATNIIKPRCSVITRLSMEHTGFLGDTLGKIAYEKASIIKDSVPVISSPQEPQAMKVISWMAKSRAAPLSVLGDHFLADCVKRDMNGVTVALSSLGMQVRVGLPGRYQCENVALAAECAMVLADTIEVSHESIIAGLSKVRWPGRLEIVRDSPLTVLDVTHTPDGARAVSSELDMFPGSPRVLVVGMLRDKDAKGAMTIMSPKFDHVICTSSHSDRALSPQEMKAACAGHKSCRAIAGVDKAVKAAMRKAGPKGFVMICGSLYTVGEAMQFLEGGNGP